MTDIHVESWTLNKNGDKQTNSKKNNFLSKISIRTVKKYRIQLNHSSKKALDTKK